MAHTATMSLAEFAAARNLAVIDLSQVKEYLYCSFVNLFSPLYTLAAQMSSVTASTDAIEANKAANSTCLDDTTLRELEAVASSIFDDIKNALENSCAHPEAIRFGVKGTLAPEDKAAFLCAFAMRSTPIKACDVDGVRITSKLPLSVSFTFNIQHAVKVRNDEARDTTTVGVGYNVSLDDLTIRSGMPLAAWNRLGQISSVQRGIGDNFGTQYQVYLFSKIRRFALGYGEVGIDLANGLPVTPINIVQTVSDWKVDEKEGA